ncbi:YD repeat protein [Crocosphaera watsonii WH 0003]|uniref:YD repeat protein n=1 Tax=Crocosphaera watsonii WH 0003 TaxID=423471 RepID=G5J798_CROWT|nr:YD repeat protein [Crocosphaera watsonii WH 0003]
MPNQIKTATERTFPSISRTSKIGINQNSIQKIAHSSINKTSTTSIHLLQISPIQISPIQSSPSQVSGEQIGISQNGFYQTSRAQINPKQIGTSQISPTKIDPFKISPSQINTPQVSPFESSNQTTNSIPFTHFPNNTNQLNSSKIAFSSLVPSQQFISSNSPNHNLTSNLVSNINNVTFEEVT